MLQPKKFPSHISSEKSCTTSYESTQIGNESTQTEIFSRLSRPARTCGKRNQRKTGNESMQGMNESTQLGFPRIESTCSDPRENGSRKKGGESTQGVRESTHSGFPELSRPIRTRGFCAESWVDSQSKNTQKCIFCNVLHLFFCTFVVCNECFRDENERNWPIEWKWIDSIHDMTINLEPEFYNWLMEAINVNLWT